MADMRELVDSLFSLAVMVTVRFDKSSPTAGAAFVKRMKQAASQTACINEGMSTADVLSREHHDGLGYANPHGRSLLVGDAY